MLHDTIGDMYVREVAVVVVEYENVIDSKFAGYAIDGVPCVDDSTISGESVTDVEERQCLVLVECFDLAVAVFCAVLVDGIVFVVEQKDDSPCVPTSPQGVLRYDAVRSSVGQYERGKFAMVTRHCRHPPPCQD